MNRALDGVIVTMLVDRGRDAHCWAPPAQIRACGFPAHGSYLGCLTAKCASDQGCKLLGFATFRTRSSACDTLSRFCARQVLCWSAFPLVPVLGSPNSAVAEATLFAGFPATTTESDFSHPCIIGFGARPSRCGPAAA